MWKMPKYNIAEQPDEKLEQLGTEIIKNWAFSAIGGATIGISCGLLGAAAVPTLLLAYTWGIGSSYTSNKNLDNILKS